MKNHTWLTVFIFNLFLVGNAISQSNFLDLKTNDLHYNAINYVSAQGIVNGYSDNTFRSQEHINRVELLKILMEANSLNQTLCNESFSYSDVDWYSWYGEYLRKASCLKIVQGDPNGTFRPSDNVNAAEGFKMISIAFGFETKSTDVWYQAYTENLILKNVIPTDIQSVTNPLTRGQVAEIIYRLQNDTIKFISPSYQSLINIYCSEIACNKITITTDENHRYINSNGIPDHQTGEFPSRGNPNEILEQDHSYRVTLNPSKNKELTLIRIAGVALNGVPFEPNTAETYDSNDDWAIEAFDADGVGGLGIDWSNAHVQPNGTYHYHAVPEGFLQNSLKNNTNDLVQVAWASDGFPIYYSQKNLYKSSWKVKSGQRPDGAPSGNYDGTYSQDFEFISNSGNLDECNGTLVDNKYSYFITDSFPYVQRCVYGTPDQTFDRKNQDNRGLPGTFNHSLDNTNTNKGSAAIAACDSLGINQVCTIKTLKEEKTGTCKNAPNQNAIICVPKL